jgi:AcrR family transcriptional regulator
MASITGSTPWGPTPIRSYPSRLPRGPHSLTREQVASNQRLRVGMAMLEAVGESGYVATTVADVVARAGVSRKAFYQHFTNKEDCFLATYDAIAAEGRRRVARTFKAAAGRSDCVETTLRTLFEAALEHPDAVRLAFTEVNAVGLAGLQRRERSITEFGQLIEDGLRTRPRSEDYAAAAALPETTRRALAGGVTRILVRPPAVRRGVKPLALMPDLARWIACYHPAPKTFVAKLKTARARQRRAFALQRGGRAPGTLTPRSRRGQAQRTGYNPSRGFIVHNQRERILDAATNLTAANGYGALTVEDIAAEAAVSLAAFYEHFESKEDAFIVAYELGHTRALDVAERALEDAPDWRTGVRDSLVGLASYLACEPAFAQLALMGATVATPRAAEISEKGQAAYTQLLEPGLAEMPKSSRLAPLALDATVGGLQEVFLHYCTQGRIAQLPEMAVDVTYVALAPFIGAQAAAEVAVEPV